jgi:hypothetical protein
LQRSVVKYMKYKITEKNKKKKKKKKKSIYSIHSSRIWCCMPICFFPAFQGQCDVLICHEPNTQWCCTTSQKRGLLTYTTAETFTLARKLHISLDAHAQYTDIFRLTHCKITFTFLPSAHHSVIVSEKTYLISEPRI